MCFGVGFVVQAASREEAETRVRHVRGAVDHTLPSLVSLTGGEFAEYDLEPGAVKDGYAACVITSWRVSDTHARVRDHLPCTYHRSVAAPTRALMSQ